MKVTLAQHAQHVVEQYETRQLTDRDRDRFLELLDDPPAPNDVLQAAAAEFQRRVTSGRLTV